MQINISERKYKNVPCLLMESNRLAVTVIPSSGGKIQSIFDKTKKKEFLFQSGREEFRTTHYGANFGEGDVSGFDEVFPTIDTCFYPSGPWTGIPIPDHGEVWTLPWACSVEGDTVQMSVHGVRFPYRLEKKIEFLRDNAFRLSYRAMNLSDFEFEFIWAPHPFFLCEAGSRVVLPPSVKRILSSCPLPNKLGAYGAILDWPVSRLPTGEAYDIAAAHPKYADVCEKFYTQEKPAEGWCALHNAVSGDAIGMSYPVAQLPYLGVWMGILNGQNIAALEPCTGAMDKLDVAKLWGQAGVIKAKSDFAWFINLTFDAVGEIHSIDEDGVIR
jgi:galactose mutarotase-like enzyme